MPLPATRNALLDVGAPGRQGPVVSHAPTRKSIACFGAVNLHTGKFVRSISVMFDIVSGRGHRPPRHLFVINGGNNKPTGR